MKTEDLALLAIGALILIPKIQTIRTGASDPRSPKAINDRWTTTWMQSKTPASPTPTITLPAEVLLGQAVPLPPETKIFPSQPGTYSINRGNYTEFYQVL